MGKNRLKKLVVLALGLLLHFSIILDAATFYVSRNGDNSDGLTWATAWSQLGDINWAVIQPGDTVLLDGGVTEMVYEPTYEKQFRVGKSGTSANPITIRLASEPGRNGKAVIRGDRPILLPYCGQTDYGWTRPRETWKTLDGISDEGCSWIVVDGMKWGGIKITATDEGLSVAGSSNTFRNIEIYDCGYHTGTTTVQPMGHGVGLGGGWDNVFERMIIHDIGQDGFQGGNAHNFVVRESMLYCDRKNPGTGEPFSYCNHNDGIQLTGTGPKGPVLIEDCVFYGWMQGIILGGNSGSPCNDVTIRNTLFYRNTTNIMGRDTSYPINWLIENVTAAEPTSRNITLDGKPHVIRDSIFLDGGYYFRQGVPACSGNYEWGDLPCCQYVGTRADPEFVDVENDDYALQPGSPATGKGSRITSVAKFWELFSDGSLKFETANYNAGENTANITVTVRRTGGTLGAVSVQYATSNGTASAGSDYTAVSGILSWSNGESAIISAVPGSSPGRG